MSFQRIEIFYVAFFAVRKAFNPWAPHKLNISFLTDSKPNDGGHKFRKTFHYIDIRPPSIFRTKQCLKVKNFHT